MDERPQPLHLDRVALYELVWSQPISKLAPKFGLSDVGLGKVCKRLKVPRPGVGYWTKLQHGKAPKRPPLPAAAPGHPTEVTIGPRIHREAEAPEVSPPEVKVPVTLRRPHSLVQQAADLLRKGGVDEYGRLWAPRDESLEIHVSRALLPRALRIMNSLVMALESRGHTVRIGKPANGYGRTGTLAVINSEELRFSLREHLDRVGHEPTPKEIAEKAKHSWASWRSYDYRLSGRLKLEIDSYESGFRKSWSDGKKTPLEEKLGPFIVGLEVLAAHERVQRLEREEEHRRWEEERHRAEEEAEKRRLEEERVKELRQLVSDWREAQEIRAFLRVVLDRSPEDEKVGEWVRWGLEVADRLDPIRSRSGGAMHEAAEAIVVPYVRPQEI